jgi:hypothetical protein
VSRVLLIACALSLALGLRAQDGWDTIPRPGDPDPFRPGEKAGMMPRTRDGKPDLSGIWQARTLANWDVQKHAPEYGYPGVPGIVEGGKIPYEDGALGKRAQMAKAPPAPPCELPGVPRITYMPYAFEIVQTPGAIHAIYEYAHAWRVIYLNRTAHLDRTAHAASPATFDGDSIAHWEGDTLVVDVAGFNDKTRLDMAGNFHGAGLHVVERYRPIDADTIWYEATLEDPQVYTRPWKLRFPLHRQAKSFELGEYSCSELESNP